MRWLRNLIGCICRKEEQEKRREPTDYERALEAQRELEPMIKSLDVRGRYFSAYSHSGEYMKTLRMDFKKHGGFLKQYAESASGPHDIIVILHGYDHDPQTEKAFCRYMGRVLDTHAEQISRWIKEEAQKELDSKLESAEKEARNILKGSRK